MSNANPSRLGQANLAGDVQALFKKQYLAEVIASFVAEYAMAGHITERNIENGKSASFPVLGTIGSEYHVPGTEINGLNVESNEVVITLDPMLISHAFIADIDAAMNHYDVRSEYSVKQGAELARKRQQSELACAIKAARATTGAVAAQPGGAVITAANMKTDATVLANALRTVRQTFDEKFVPDQDVAAAIKPAQYYLLTSNKDLCDSDFSRSPSGSYSDAVISSVARIQLVKTNNLPSTDLSADASVLTKYQGDYSKTAAVVFHKSAVGTLKLLDVALESSYDPRRLGTLMVTKYALGTGTLRVSGAAELATA